jgi:Uma2 family endonuclease
MDGAIHSEPERELIRTGPIELRDVGPNGRKLGTPADCEDDDTPWELHRGELVERPVSHEIHSVVMTVLGGLFLNHVRDGYSVLIDIHCVLDDAHGESRRAPDVVIAHEIKNPKGEALRGIPVLAVEVRATQGKKHLEEKVKLYLEHDWPTVWNVHTERREVEVVRPGVASVTYRPGASVPLPPELDKYGLSLMPVTAFFDMNEASKYIDQWVRTDGFNDGRTVGFNDGRARERANSLLDVLAARSLNVPLAIRERITSCTDIDTLQRWFALALTTTNVDMFVQGMD